MVVFFYLDDIQTTGNLLKAEVFMLLALATGLWSVVCKMAQERLLMWVWGSVFPCNCGNREVRNLEMETLLCDDWEIVGNKDTVKDSSVLLFVPPLPCRDSVCILFFYYSYFLLALWFRGPNRTFSGFVFPLTCVSYPFTQRQNTKSWPHNKLEIFLFLWSPMNLHSNISSINTAIY